MTRPSPALPDNASHKSSEDALEQFALELVPTTEPPTLLLWAERYLQTKVIGVQSENTEQAKRRDLRAFLRFFAQLNYHLAIEQWLSRDTRAFIAHLEVLGRAPTTVNRMLHTLGHFARWVHEQPSTPFAERGLPTAGIKQLAVQEPEPRKLSRREVWRLFKAADNLVLTEDHQRARPRRNRAILAILFYTGLRVSELASLRLEQWDGKRFRDVRRKGNVRTKLIYLPAEARRLLIDYLESERPRDDHGSGWLLLPSFDTGDTPMTRRQIHRILVRIADEATKHQGAIHLHPHRLRHTFGFEVRARTRSDSETARLLGHQSDSYAGRYARSSQQEREQLLDTLEVSPGGAEP